MQRKKPSVPRLDSQLQAQTIQLFQCKGDANIECILVIPKKHKIFNCNLPKKIGKYSVRATAGLQLGIRNQNRPWVFK